MEQVKQKISESVDSLKDQLIEMSDKIHDNPELSFEEYNSSKMLADFLEKHGFKVQKNIAGLETAFCATYEHLKGGPTIGLLCEYDALKGLGHGCGHNLQGPSIIGAAIAIMNNLGNYPVKIKVFGTPGEETKGGKIPMINAGLFNNLDVAFMMHAGDRTTVDNKAMALTDLTFDFKGKSAHAAIAPEEGRSALDGVMMTFNGIEYLREHVRDDVRIHGIVTNGGMAPNIVPDKASADFSIRSYDRPYLDEVIKRVMNVAKGAALATGTTVEIKETKSFDNKISVKSINELLIENARLYNAPNITPPRKKTGSTDFSSVMYRIPGACLRVAFVPINVSSHSKMWVDAGKSSEAHNAVVIGAKSIAGACYDIISNPQKLEEIKKDFKEAKDSFTKTTK